MYERIAASRRRTPSTTRGVAGGEQLGEVLDRDAQRVDGGEQVAVVLGVVPGVADDVDHRRQRRDVPDHRHRAVLRVQRERDLVGLDQRMDRRALRGQRPSRGGCRRARPRRTTSGSFGSRRTSRWARVEIVLVAGRRGRQHPVGVVQHEAEVAQPADAGLRADRRDADLDPREAEGALLGLAGAVVEVDLLVRAARHAHPPATAAVLVDQHDPVLGALVDRAARAGRGAGRVQAVLADPRQVEHERVLEATS